MSGWSEATSELIPRLWPLARSAHLAYTQAGFERWIAEEPWRARMSPSGDAMLLNVWRRHLRVLAIRGLWSAPGRIPLAVEEASRVADEHGFISIVSPLVAASAWEHYEAAGMTVREHLVALQGTAARVPVRVSPLPIRVASAEDLAGLLGVDATAFDAFWRYGAVEMGAALAGERITVVCDGDTIAGYASAAVLGPTCTLGRLAIAPQWRRSGLGSALVSEVADWAVRSGAGVLSLCTQATNVQSRGLYARLGLTEVREPYALLEQVVGAERGAGTV